MNRYLEKKNKRYVIATLDVPSRYLRSLTRGQYVFVNEIEAATKTLSSSIAQSVLMDYYRDFGRDIEMIVVPLEIEYWFPEEN